MSALYESVTDIFADRFGIDRATVTPDASFDDIGLDSLSQIELATAIKKKYAVEISDDEMAEMSIVSEIVEKLEELLAEKGVTV